MVDIIGPRIQRAVVIEDELYIALDIEAILEKLGIEAISLPNGDKLLDVIDDFDPQLILLDIRLQTSDAFAIIKSNIRSDFGGVVSIISGSGVDMMLDATLVGERKGLRMGPPITKPFTALDIEYILNAAEQLLERERISSEARTIYEEQAAHPVLSLRDALEADRLEIWYQPKFRLRDGAICGAEALIRGRTADGTLVQPNALFAGASQADYLQLTDHVIERSVEHVALLGKQGFNHRISVNVPMSFLRERDAARHIRKAAAQPRWPGMLFEITEDEALANAEDIRDVAMQLKLYGVDLSMDDFGAGYSSLARLRDLPFTELKVDRSFIHGCASDSMKYAICRSVLALGAELGCSTVAEGVENAEDMEVCIELGCDVVQGFCCAKPMPFEELMSFIAKLGYRALDGG